MRELTIIALAVGKERDPYEWYFQYKGRSHRIFKRERTLEGHWHLVFYKWPGTRFTTRLCTADREEAIKQAKIVLEGVRRRMEQVGPIP